MRTAVSTICAAMVCLLLSATQSANACPEGTVFSAYKGNGICAFIGQGAKVAVQCYKADGKCPSGTTREKKKSDPNAYCCPTVVKGKSKQCTWRGTAPFCEGQCLFGEEYKGSARNKEGAGYAAGMKGWSNLFGKDCASGSKALCCYYR
jgi:hypothetical protein